MCFTKIGLGGGCHWCTEAVFKSLKGVQNVQQGYIASTGVLNSFSEAILLEYNAEIMPLMILVEIHLRTHKSTSNHSFRNEYRSAVYCFSQSQTKKVTQILNILQPRFNFNIITRALPFKDFKESRQEIKNYYFKDPKKPFCVTYIEPKLQLLQKEYAKHISAKAL